MDDAARFLSLASAISQQVASRFPEWTESNDSDPGVTLLDLFAWLTEYLSHSLSAANPRSRLAARRLVAAASALANDKSDSDAETLLRVNYFDGQLLDADDFRTEQNYFRQRLRLVNRRVHGVGVVCGLEVSIKGKGNAAHVEISPGVAIDPNGEEIALKKCETAPLPGASKELYVQLRWTERLCMPVVAAEDSELPQYSRIADSWETLVSPVAAHDAVTLAHLKRNSGRWTMVRARRSRSRG